jgi:hypothetical protein
MINGSSSNSREALFSIAKQCGEVALATEMRMNSLVDARLDVFDDYEDANTPKVISTFSFCSADEDRMRRLCLESGNCERKKKLAGKFRPANKYDFGVLVRFLPSVRQYEFLLP